jgi:hypothetical protein
MTATRQPSRKINVTLWIVQVLLGAAFVFAGADRLVSPIAELTKLLPLPGSFLRFVGVAELAGGLGLILPGLFRIRPELTPIAARCLIILMCGAVALALQASYVIALLPFSFGVLLSFVAYGRTHLAPITASTRRRPSASQSWSPAAPVTQNRA